MSNLAQIADQIDGMSQELREFEREMQARDLARAIAERLRQEAAARIELSKTLHAAHVNLRRRVREGYLLQDAQSIAYGDSLAILGGSMGDVDPYADWQPEQHGGWRGD